MKLDITKDVEDQKTTYVLTIEKSDLIPIRFTKYDKEILDLCERSDKISDKLMGLNVVARRIEQKSEQPKVYKV